MMKIFFPVLLTILMILTGCFETVDSYKGSSDFTVDGTAYSWSGTTLGFIYAYAGPEWSGTFAEDPDNLFAHRNQLNLTIENYDDITPGTYYSSNTRARYWDNSGTEYDTDISGEMTITIDTWSGGRTTGSFTGTIEGLSVSGTFSTSYTKT